MKVSSIVEFSADRFPNCFVSTPKEKILVEKLTSYISSTTTYQDVNIEEYVIGK